ncbi:MAG: hypothetical protein ACKVJF_01780, partial [Flavobacteriales bacterium]
SFTILISDRVLGLRLYIKNINTRVHPKLTNPEKIKIRVFISLIKTGMIKLKKVKLIKKYTLNCKYLLDILFLSNSLAKKIMSKMMKKEMVLDRETLLEK